MKKEQAFDSLWTLLLLTIIIIITLLLLLFISFIQAIHPYVP